MSRKIRPPMEGSYETQKMTLFSIPNSPGNSSPNRKETQERRRMVPFQVNAVQKSPFSKLESRPGNSSPTGRKLTKVGKWFRFQF